MSKSIIKLFEKGGGKFISPPSSLIRNLKKIRAIAFDWDGVFNPGFKAGVEGSPFSEVDAMGTNMLRYAIWKFNGAMPVTCVITGEQNPSGKSLAEREHFHAYYSGAKSKMIAFESFCKSFKTTPAHTIFFFDDVLDLEVAKQCGARIMIGRRSNPLLLEYAKKSSAVDYITANSGATHGLREGCELVMGLLGVYDDVISNRSAFSEDYQKYLTQRQRIEVNITDRSGRGLGGHH